MDYLAKTNVYFSRSEENGPRWKQNRVKYLLKDKAPLLLAACQLWQGGLGYAVTTQETNYNTSSVTVLLLRAENRKVEISLEYVLPIKFLLPSISQMGEVKNEDVKLLKAFIEEL